MGCRNLHLPGSLGKKEFLVSAKTGGRSGPRITGMDSWGSFIRNILEPLEFLGPLVGDAGPIAQAWDSRTGALDDSNMPSGLRAICPENMGSEHWDGTDTKPHTEKRSDLQASGMPWREVPPCPSTIWTGQLTSSHCTKHQESPETEAVLGTEGR